MLSLYNFGSQNKNNNKKKKEENDSYFSCQDSPYKWELSNDPYSDIRRKKIPKLKKTYSSMSDYRSIIEPLFHIECKESLRQFNEKLNEEKFIFKTNAVKVDVKNIIEPNSLSNFSSYNNYTISLTMPNYFVIGYDGMYYNEATFKNKEKRSSGPIKKQDLLYIGKVSNDFKERYFETLMFFNDTIGVYSEETAKVIEELLNDNSSSSSSSFNDEEELTKGIEQMKITEDLDPEAQLSVLCKARMTRTKYNEFLIENLRERGQWVCYHIMSFGPIKKEYNTLVNLTENPIYPICNIITSGKIGMVNASSMGGSNSSISENIANRVSELYRLNPSQTSIIKKVRNRQFSLVQGPPGTGKTTTIIAIIISRLIEALSMQLPFKILVCAPSNHACDEIAKRLEKEEEKVKFLRAFRYKADDNLPEKELKEELITANVVVCTLCCSGNSFLNDLTFDLLIVDEACQCTELTVLIPFCYNISQSILIGDPKQLPPTIKNHKIEKYDYGKSLFERIQEGSPSSEVYLLNTQYRMHPNISKLSSKCFYDGKIEDGPNVKSNKWIKEYTKDSNSPFGPVLFYHIKGTISNGRNSSFCNEEEATQVVNCATELLQLYSKICFHKKISIISPYSAQVHLIKRKLKELYKNSLESLFQYMNITNDKILKFYEEDIEIGSDERYRKLLNDEDIFNHISVSTVDGFQGQENDIVIISTVRTDGKIGFLKDKRRLNVSISRSRYSLIIFGDYTTLAKNEDWEKITDLILDMGCLKIKGNNYFNESNYFPSNLLPKKFFEHLKNQIEQEKLIEKAKKILLNDSLENELSNELILYYNVPAYSSSKKLDSKDILIPSHIIGSCIQKIIDNDLFQRLEPFTSKIINSIKYIVSKKTKDGYFWLANAFELKCIIETIYEKEMKIREEADAEAMLNALNGFNNLVIEIYEKNIWKPLCEYIKSETKLQITKVENSTSKDIFYYLSRTNKKLNYFNINSSICSQLLNNFVNLACSSWLNNYNINKNYIITEYVTKINNIKSFLEINYQRKIKLYAEKLKKWCIRHEISDGISFCDNLLKAFNNDNLNSIDNDLISSFNKLRISDNTTTISQFVMPPYHEVKKLKIKNNDIPKSAYNTCCLFELKV
eukprot:jgi/Orpsp1_1/1176749/evm.model.c7180000058858.1